MTDKLVSSFTGATADLVTPDVATILLDYIDTNWNDNFDWNGTDPVKPMTPKTTVKFGQWWAGIGAMTIDANNIYTSVQPQELGNGGLVERSSDVRLDIFARQINAEYPSILYTVVRFLRSLLALNPRALENKGIHDFYITREQDVPEPDPRSSIYHYQFTVELKYMHNVVAA